MVFATASGKTIVLPPGAGKRIFWEVQDGLSAESHFSDKDAPYQNYRRRRLGEGGTGTPGTYSVAIARTAQKQLDRIGEESVRKLDRVIISLSRQPKIAGSKNLKWLRPDFWLIRRADYPIVYSVDDRAKHLRILNVGFCLQHTIRVPSQSHRSR
jgi:mRNA-degrading endonuclease RelE of RelBE toxin-antitoxin system